MNPVQHKVMFVIHILKYMQCYYGEKKIDNVFKTDILAIDWSTILHRVLPMILI